MYVLLHGVEALNRVTPYDLWPAAQVVDPGVAYAREVFEAADLRIFLEAFLLAGATQVEIREALKLGEDEISAYNTLFFDVSVFKNDLEILSYVRAMPDADPYKDLLFQAYHEGPKALQWHLCRDKGYVDATEVTQTLMTDAYFRALAQRGRPSSSKIAREAMKSASLAIACARTLKDQGPVDTGTVDDIRFQFVEGTNQNRTHADFAASGIDITH